MARIIRPEDRTSESQSFLNQDLPGRQASGIAAIGESAVAAGNALSQTNIGAITSQLGNAISAEGKRYFEESKAAWQESQVSNMMADATIEFLGAKEQRYKQVVDKDGNPTFMNLTNDIGSIGKRIIEKYSSKSLDGEVNRKFSVAFNNYINHQRISAFKEARSMQLAYARSSLDKSLQTYLTQGASDDLSNLSSYELQGQKSLDNAYKAGTISQEEHMQKSYEFKLLMREQGVRNAIQNSTREASVILDNSTAESLGVTPEVKQKLDTELHAKITSDRIEEQKIAERKQIDNQNNQVMLAEELRKRIQADSLREDELLRQKDNLSTHSFKAIKKNFLEQAEKNIEQRRTFNAIGQDILNGQDLNKYSQAQLTDYYDNLIGQREQITGQKASFADKAETIVAMHHPMPSFASELELGFKYGDTSNAADYLAAFTYIEDRNSTALDSGFDSKATLIATKVEQLVSKGGMSPPEALILARNELSKVTSEVRDFRSNEFNTIEDFKDINLLDTAAKDLAPKFYFFSNQITDQAALDYRKFVKEGYILAGNESDARAYAKKMMNRNYGISEVGDEKQYMFQPPEKSFPQFSSDQLTNILKQEVKQKLGTEDIGPITIKTDRFSTNKIQVIGTDKDGRQQAIDIKTWIVEHEVDGIKTPITDPLTGLPMRWTPMGSTVLSDQLQLELDEARETEKAIEVNRDKYIKQQQQSKEMLDKANQSFTDIGIFK